LNFLWLLSLFQDKESKNARRRDPEDLLIPAQVLKLKPANKWDGKSFPYFFSNKKVTKGAIPTRLLSLRSKCPKLAVGKGAGRFS